MLNHPRPLIITLITGITMLINMGCSSVETPPVGNSSPNGSPSVPQPTNTGIQSAPASLPQSTPSATLSPVPTSAGGTPSISPSLSTVPQVITPPTSGCKIIMAKVNDLTPLNVRSRPELVEGNIVGQLDNHTWVSVAEEKQEWFRITQPLKGWISKNKTKSSCANIEKVINLTTNNQAIVRGEMVGTGTHRYLIKANQGQTLTIQKNAGVFPMIISPNQQILGGDPYRDSQRTEWTGKIPVTGNYLLQFDSNYKGFTYDFSVTLVKN